MYNQLAQEQTHYSCSVYAFLNCILLDYWVQLKVDWILKLVIYMEKIWVLLPWGASASVIFPALVKYTEYKTGFKLKIVKWTIYKLWTKSTILWLKKSNRTYLNLADDWEITKKDIDSLNDSKGWYGHFHCYKRWNILETLWWFRYKISKDILNYAKSKDLYYTATRSFIPADTKTADMQKKLVSLVRSRKRFISYNEFLNLRDK